MQDNDVLPFGCWEDRRMHKRKHLIDLRQEDLSDRDGEDCED